jgi:hypothetical protein
MESLFFAVLGFTAMILVSLVAWARAPSSGELPMLWDMKGHVKLSAPRWLAVTFTPTLCLFLLWFASIVSSPAAIPFGTEAVIISCCTLVHMVHMAMAVRSEWDA